MAEVGAVCVEVEQVGWDWMARWLGCLVLGGWRMGKSKWTCALQGRVKCWPGLGHFEHSTLEK